MAPNNAERTYIMIKVEQFLISSSPDRSILISAIIPQPDGVQRALVGKIIARFEERGFKLTALKLVHATTEHLEKR